MKTLLTAQYLNNLMRQNFSFFNLGKEEEKEA